MPISRTTRMIDRAPIFMNACIRYLPDRDRNDYLNVIGALGHIHEDMRTQRAALDIQYSARELYLLNVRLKFISDLWQFLLQFQTHIRRDLIEPCNHGLRANFPI